MKLSIEQIQSIYFEHKEGQKEIKIKSKTHDFDADKEIAECLIKKLHAAIADFYLSIGISTKRDYKTTDILDVEIALYRGCILLDKQRHFDKIHVDIRNLIIHGKATDNDSYLNLAKIMITELIDRYFSEELQKAE